MENLPVLRGQLLRSVSRSFYLSIRLLPLKLRDPIGLAYLLARATDTIADTAEADTQLRARELAALAARIQGNGLTSDSLRTFVELQRNEAERRLIETVPACLNWLESMPKDDRADIREVLVKINEGQRLDLIRSSLQTDDELEHYIYLVAGSVGEFWTSICSRHLPRFADLPKEKMNSLGVAYGEGLQLINILRDLGADRSAGRTYLPNFDPENPRLALDFWRSRAEEGIAAGLDYACAIRAWRVRLATVLPALIGARTLALLREAGTDVFERKVKVSRAEVRVIVWKTAASFAAPRRLRAAFARLSS